MNINNSYFNFLIDNANYINDINVKLKKILPANLQNITLVNIDNSKALMLVDNAALLTLAKNSNIASYLKQLRIDVSEVIFEITRH